MRQKVAGILPARLDCSRLPRKALADIRGMPIIVHFYRRCLLAFSLDQAFMATNSEEVTDAVRAYGGKSVMTKKVFL
jgi:3-deoxy-manno-octulosonate cytidylyltransferase (CMP-KDO synthetase)